MYFYQEFGHKAGSVQEAVDWYEDKNKEQSILIRLYEDMKTIAEPDFISSWEIDSKLVKQLPFYGTSYPGLILAAKFYEPILHDGSKRKRS